MGNIATNTIIQIEKLRSRGMNLDLEESKIKEILLDIGYYRLGFYWNPFEIDEEHNFKVGTKFSDAVKLYYLDVDLRNLLMKYIHRIEINFRTKLVYYVSNSNKDFPTWFIHPDVIKQDFINSIERHYDDDFKSKNNPIKLHHQKYINDKYAPAWKTLEFFTFGTILKIFKSLKNEDIKKRISKEYDVLNLKKFTNIINTIVYVRNICSHGGVLFDLNTPLGMSVLPQIDFNRNENNRHSLDSAIKLIMFILSQISSRRKDDMENSLIGLFNGHKENEIIKELIVSKTGYVFGEN